MSGRTPIAYRIGHGALHGTHCGHDGCASNKQLGGIAISVDDNGCQGRTNIAHVAESHTPVYLVECICLIRH